MNIRTSLSSLSYRSLHKKWRELRIWSHLLKKSLMENFIFRAVGVTEGMQNLSDHRFNKLYNLRVFIQNNRRLEKKLIFSCCFGMRLRFPFELNISWLTNWQCIKLHQTFYCAEMSCSKSTVKIHKILWVIHNTLKWSGVANVIYIFFWNLSNFFHIIRLSLLLRSIFYAPCKVIANIDR